LAFEVNDITHTREYLMKNKVVCEAIRVDEFTEKAFFFIADPDGLPIEFYEK
jgi:glyoxylase I family protein